MYTIIHIQHVYDTDVCSVECSCYLSDDVCIYMGGLVCFELLSHAQGACFLFNLSFVIFSEGGCVRERLTTHHILNAITLEPL